MQTNPNMLYTVKECCALLKIGRNKMLELIWNQEIEAFKLGRSWRISEQALREYIFQHQ